MIDCTIEAVFGPMISGRHQRIDWREIVASFVGDGSRGFTKLKPLRSCSRLCPDEGIGYHRISIR